MFSQYGAKEERKQGNDDKKTSGKYFSCLKKMGIEMRCSSHHSPRIAVYILGMYVCMQAFISGRFAGIYYTFSMAK